MAKHLINGKDDWASEGIKGYLSANNKDLVALKEFPNVVIRRDYATLGQNNRVAILAGGGSGHEPAHCGFIGAGMLTGVVGFFYINIDRAHHCNAIIENDLFK